MKHFKVKCQTTELVSRLTLRPSLTKKSKFFSMVNAGTEFTLGQGIHTSGQGAAEERLVDLSSLRRWLSFQTIQQKFTYHVVHFMLNGAQQDNYAPSGCEIKAA